MVNEIKAIKKGVGRMRHRILVCIGSVCLASMVISGCGRHKSSLLLERQASGPVEEEHEIAKSISWSLEPAAQTQDQSGVEVSVTYASSDYLNKFFGNKKVFGKHAGLNPYFQEQIVFYVKLSNKSGKKIFIEPVSFTVVDDKGNQYYVLGPDYAKAIAESKAPFATMTRGVIDEARPGYFGVSVPVGKVIGKSPRRSSLLNMATLRNGYLYDGVVYDGMVAFWSPHREAKKLKLLMEVKTDFNAQDEATTTLNFNYDFTSSANKK
jgi:hypothetical protein